MGYFEIVRKVDPSELSRCDGCDQDQVTSSGKTYRDSEGHEILWLCFNCVVRQERSNK